MTTLCTGTYGLVMVSIYSIEQFIAWLTLAHTHVHTHTVIHVAQTMQHSNNDDAHTFSVLCTKCVLGTCIPFNAPPRDNTTHIGTSSNEYTTSVYHKTGPLYVHRAPLDCPLRQIMRRVQVILPWERLSVWLTTICTLIGNNDFIRWQVYMDKIMLASNNFILFPSAFRADY